MLAEALRAEVESYLDRFTGELDEAAAFIGSHTENDASFIRLVLRDESIQRADSHVVELDVGELGLGLDDDGFHR